MYLIMQHFDHRRFCSAQLAVKNILPLYSSIATTTKQKKSPAIALKANPSI